MSFIWTDKFNTPDSEVQKIHTLLQMTWFRELKVGACDVISARRIPSCFHRYNYIWELQLTGTVHKAITFSMILSQLQTE